MILKGGLESCALRHARTVTGPDFGTTFPGRVGIRIYAVYGQALVSVQLQLTLALVGTPLAFVLAALAVRAGTPDTHPKLEPA